MKFIVAERAKMLVEAMQKLSLIQTNVKPMTDEDVKAICKLIDLFPTVEGQIVVHGKWIKTEAAKNFSPESFEFEVCDAAQCSVCSSIVIPYSPDFAFCPHCGAMMNEVEE